MLNEKKNFWKVIQEESDFPPFNEKVLILVEEDCIQDEEHDMDGDRYYPMTYYARLDENYQWNLLYEDEDCEQIILQSQTVVAWRLV